MNPMTRSYNITSDRGSRNLYKSKAYARPQNQAFEQITEEKEDESGIIMDTSIDSPVKKSRY